MPLRLFADHCVSNSIIDTLQKADHIVFRLRDHIPKDSPDPIVIEKANELDTILISLNGDFSDIVNYPPRKYKGIIALQVRNHPETIPLILSRIISYFHDHPDMDYYIGKLFLVEAHRIRVRK